MADIEDVATREVGGVPLWVWGGAVAAVIVGYAWWRNSSGGGDTGPSSYVDTSSGDENALSGGLIGPGSSANYTSPPATDTGDGSSDMSVDDWLTQALNAVKGSGVDQYTATQSLSKFLNGSQLTTYDVQTIDKALESVGLPPGYATGIAPFASDNVSPTSPNQRAADAALAKAKDLAAKAAKSQSAADKQAAANAAKAAADAKADAARDAAAKANAAKANAAKQRKITTANAKVESSLRSLLTAWNRSAGNGLSAKGVTHINTLQSRLARDIQRRGNLGGYSATTSAYERFLTLWSQSTADQRLGRAGATHIGTSLRNLSAEVKKGNDR